MYTELTAGYHVDAERLINNAVFDVDYSEMVVVKDIPFYSCASTTCCRSSGMRPWRTSRVAR
jgi:GTP cyclohydrolase I